MATTFENICHSRGRNVGT